MSGMIQGIDHVQIAAPPGCEPQDRAFYAIDPFVNRLEFLEWRKS